MAASFALAVAAGGAAKSAETARLLNGQEWIDSLPRAQGCAGPGSATRARAEDSYQLLGALQDHQAI